MISFPYNYNDDLTSTEAKENRGLFFKKYGSTLITNSVLFVFTKQANAKDKVDTTTVAEALRSPPKFVFASILPLTPVIK